MILSFYFFSSRVLCDWGKPEGGLFTRGGTPIPKDPGIFSAPIGFGWFCFLWFSGFLVGFLFPLFSPLTLSERCSWSPVTTMVRKRTVPATEEAQGSAQPRAVGRIEQPEDSSAPAPDEVALTVSKARTAEWAPSPNYPEAEEIAKAVGTHVVQAASHTYAWFTDAEDTIAPPSQVPKSIPNLKAPPKSLGPPPAVSYNHLTLPTISSD